MLAVYMAQRTMIHPASSVHDTEDNEHSIYIFLLFIFTTIITIIIKRQECCLNSTGCPVSVAHPGPLAGRRQLAPRR